MIAYNFRLSYNRIEIISPDNLIPIPLLNKVDCSPAVYFVIKEEYIYQLLSSRVLF